MRFRTEANAYAYILSRNVAGVVPQCYGWFELDDLLERVRALPSVLLSGLHGQDPSITKGLVLEDLVGALRPTVHKISLDFGELALRALHHLHSVYILHGKPDKDNVLVFPETMRIVWVGFSHAVCQSAVTRQALLAELAEGWAFIYQRLVSPLCLS